MENKSNYGIQAIDSGKISVGGDLINTVTITPTTAPDADAALLQELADAQKQLADLAPKIADAIGELREAVEKKDQKTIGKKIAELASGTAAKIVSGVAGGAVLHFLGLG